MNSWLNYHHLYYFWAIAREHSISAAASKLRLSQPTLSAQLKQLEESLEVQLFERQGRSLVITEEGRVVFRYAENIFALGSELQAVVKGGATGFSLKLRVGVTDSVPKFITHKTLLPVKAMKESVKIECYEGKREDLLSQLGTHELDLVFSDAPFSSEVAVKAFNHPLGASGVSFVATEKLIKATPGSGAERFSDAPFILPTRNTMLRRAVDTWFDSHDIRPQIIAEFEDSALLKTFGSEGYGFFPIASAVEKEVERHYHVKRAIRLRGVKEEFFAISLERKVTHPAIAAITRAAKKHLQQ